MGWGFSKLGSSLTDALRDGWDATGGKLWDEASGAADKRAEDKRGQEYADKFDIPGFDRRDQQAQDALNRFGNFNAQSVGESSFRGDQQSLIDMFRDRASGADSQSRRDLRDSADRSRRFALAQSAAGGSPMSARLASQQLGGIESGLRGQQASVGIMERGQSGELAGMLAGQARGQDQARGFGNANLGMMAEQLRQSGTFGAMDRDLANALARQGGTIQGYGLGKGTKSEFGQGIGTLGKLGMQAAMML
jgi:hypothetical protein